MSRFRPMTLSGAIALAANKHRDQKDKGGNPYVLHCLHVMHEMYAVHGEEMGIAGVLHDIVEDTDVTFDNLAAWHIPVAALRVITVVTRNKKETYREYIEGIAQSKLIPAIHLKIADLEHNCDTNRLPLARIQEFTSLIQREKKALNYLAFGVWK